MVIHREHELHNTHGELTSRVSVSSSIGDYIGLNVYYHIHTTHTHTHTKRTILLKIRAEMCVSCNYTFSNELLLH